MHKLKGGKSRRSLDLSQQVKHEPFCLQQELKNRKARALPCLGSPATITVTTPRVLFIETKKLKHHLIIPTFVSCKGLPVQSKDKCKFNPSQILAFEFMCICFQDHPDLCEQRTQINALNKATVCC